jgi:hypothetical protein
MIKGTELARDVRHTPTFKYKKTFDGIERVGEIRTLHYYGNCLWRLATADIRNCSLLPISFKF